MKKLIYLVFVLVSGACSKDERPAQSSIKDTRNVQLKGMTSDGLPSPYFQFTYDTNRYITRIEHAAGLLQYELQYEKGRLVRMASNTPLNKDTLIYRYESNTLSRVDLVDINGRKIKEAELSYDPQNRLKEIRWNEVKADFSSLPTRKLVFSYDNRNNISSFEDFRNSGHGLKLVQTHFYDKYDDKINPESNFIVKDVFEHFLFFHRCNCKETIR